MIDKQKAKRKRLRKFFKFVSTVEKRLRKTNPQKYKRRIDPRMNRQIFLKCNNREDNDCDNCTEA